MELKQHFLAAWKSGLGHEDLLALVRQHQAAGMTREAAYDTIEEIWREHGFDKSTEDGPARDNLEYVLERIWYQGTDAA